MHETPTEEEMENADAGHVCIECDPRRFVEMAMEVEKKSQAK